MFSQGEHETFQPDSDAVRRWMKPEQPEQTHDIPLKNLPEYLRAESEAFRKRYSTANFLYVLLDMPRIQGEAREKAVEKLEGFKYEPLIKDTRYPALTWHGPQLVHGGKGGDEALLDAWGESDGEIVSAWIVSKARPQPLARHLRKNVFVKDVSGQEFLLRYYDPKTLPILHRVADQKWVEWFLFPIKAWWYPVATPTEENWSRIQGSGRIGAPEPDVSLVIGEELWDALVSDPLAYEVLNVAEKKFPAAFESKCYGVRLAQIENLLESAKANGLEARADQLAYAIALLGDPARADEPRWQAAIQSAAAEEAPLKTYFAQA